MVGWSMGWRILGAATLLLKSIMEIMNILNQDNRPDLKPALNLDLRLLRVFVAVYETRSVTAAARQLDMSQPGLSTALARLRVQLGDRLFTKTSAGMEPTHRARVLVGPARGIIHSIERELLAPPGFDPGTSTKEFRFALSDIGEGIYLPLAIRAIEQSAPGITLRSVFMPPRQLEEAMASGEVDLAAGFFPDIKTGDFFQRRVGLHSFTCIARANHPVARGQLTMKQFSELGHVVVEAPGRSQEVFERFLKDKRLSRHVILRTPHFMSVPTIVAETNAIATVPQALGDFITAQPDVVQVGLPFTPPTFQVNLFWHRSAQQDPANKWLRDMLIAQFPTLQARAYDRNGMPGKARPRAAANAPAPRPPKK